MGEERERERERFPRIWGGGGVFRNYFIQQRLTGIGNREEEERAGRLCDSDLSSHG